MNLQLKAILDAALPVVLTSLVTYWPQWTSSMQKRGGWWAVGGTALVVVGNVVYRLYMT